MKDNTAPKPRVFIGSSKEGKGIAYAIQQNLLREAEATVWDQGVFDLSATTIESLTVALEESDFGIFVFSADDAVKLRGNEFAAIRDNVLFETGLFIGKLGRSRVFFLTPSNTELRIPSDLLGVTPAIYDTTRTDDNMQAATGPACHQIGTQIKKLGSLPGRKMAPSDPEPEAEKHPAKYDWLFDYFAGDFNQAKDKLAKSLETLSGEELLDAKTWMLCCEIKAENTSDFGKLFKFAKENPDSVIVHTRIAMFLGLEHYNDLALKFLSEASASVRDDVRVLTRQSALHVSNNDPDLALSLLQSASPSKRPAIALKMAEILQEQEKLEDALDVIHACYLENPGDKEVRFKYARLAQDSNLPLVALYLLNSLRGCLGMPLRQPLDHEF